MEENEKDLIEINSIKEFVKDGRIDDAVKIIALYLGDSTEENYIDRLENIIELLMSLHGGRIVLRFLIRYPNSIASSAITSGSIRKVSAFSTAAFDRSILI